MKEILDRWGGAIAIILGVLVIGGALFFLGQWMTGSAVSPEVRLPLLAIAGVVVLLVTLALVAVSFAALRLTDATQALALPEGSVRAVLALSLVVLFAITTIYLFGSLSSGELKRLDGLNEAQRSSFVKSAPASGIAIVAEAVDSVTQQHTVFYQVGQTPASQDFAKQLLVLIGTLVTSVSSFYFGTRATASTTAGSDTGPPSINAVTPLTVPRGKPGDLAIAGSNMALVTGVRLAQGRVEITATDVTSSATMTKCTVNPEATAPTGKWDIVITDSSGRAATLGGAITLT
jgi:hypothetical protein